MGEWSPLASKAQVVAPKRPIRETSVDLLHLRLRCRVHALMATGLGRKEWSPLASKAQVVAPKRPIRATSVDLLHLHGEEGVIGACKEGPDCCTTTTSSGLWCGPEP